MKSRLGSLAVSGLASVLFAQAAYSQVFQYNTNNADMLLGLRKTGGSQGSFELVVNLGSVTNYANLASGVTVTNLTNFYAASQVASAFSNNNNLNWSVSAAFFGNSFAGYPRATLWLTNPRTNVGVQSTPYDRASLTTESGIRQSILSIGAGAVQISQNLGAASSNNTATLVREPINDVNNLSAFIGGLFDSTLSDYQGQWQASVELTTPASFTTPVRTDLYEVRPTGTVDPHSGLTTGPAYFVGYFEMGTNGIVTFTRASTNAPPPPAPTLTFNRTGNTSTISFGTTNGATYNLIFTNLAGLSVARSNWPTTGPTIIGNGSATNFTDTTADPTRVYGVKVH